MKNNKFTYLYPFLMVLTLIIFILQSCKPLSLEELLANLSISKENLIDMVAVDGGEFSVGSVSFLVSSFRIGKYEVLQTEYKEIIGRVPNERTESSYPAYGLSWYKALVFCNKLSIKEGFDPVYTILGSTNPDDWGSVPWMHNLDWDKVIMDLSANGYRLPTAVEWHYAAQGGKKSKGYMYSGSNDVDRVAWHNGNSDYLIKPVGGKEPNELGLYDMSGNVWEWCWDINEDKYPRGTYKDYTGPDSSSLDNKSTNYRKIRGGGANWGYPMASVFEHLGYDPSRGDYYNHISGATWNDFGFRVVRSFR